MIFLYCLVPGLSVLKRQSRADTSAIFDACWDKKVLYEREKRTVTNARMWFILTRNRLNLGLNLQGWIVKQQL